VNFSTDKGRPIMGDENQFATPQPQPTLMPLTVAAFLASLTLAPVKSARNAWG